ncbi:MAG: hypothetical protein U9R38_07785 [Candidatus Margulisiibacteriota bacterium]|nr:hypothetical protein [Candidatus Margulisiibacteriota bacterium]
MSKNDIVKRAIELKKPISFHYNKGDKVRGERRGNPHVLYISPSSGMLMIDVFQTSGVTDTGPLPKWGRFHVDYVDDLRLLDTEPSFDVADGYAPDSDRYSQAITKI